MLNNKVGYGYRIITLLVETYRNNSKITEKIQVDLNGRLVQVGMFYLVAPSMTELTEKFPDSELLSHSSLFSVLIIELMGS